MELPSHITYDAARQMRLAMRLSLGVGGAMLAGKAGAYFLTGSAAILSDAIESVIHVVAVAFAAFSLRVSFKPADRRFPFGYERISFFSAGFEGALIILAAVTIIVAAIGKWMAGLPLERLGDGTLMVFGASVLNVGLGCYLLRVGRRNQSLILEANGRHVLADSITSFGVVAGLVLVMVTGWKPFDPLCAIAVALNILWSGGNLVRRSVSGLLDYSDPATEQELRTKLNRICKQLGVQYHGLRFRNTGHRLMIEIHLLFPFDTGVGEAHRLATDLEERLPKEMDIPAEVVTHLESLEDHSEVHRKQRHAPGSG